MKKSALLIAAMAVLVVAFVPAGAGAKVRQCGAITWKISSTVKLRVGVSIVRGSVSCRTARTVIVRGYTAHPVKGWTCVDTRQGGGSRRSYPDECHKGRVLVRAGFVGYVN